jgi:hypothetical protein
MYKRNHRDKEVTLSMTSVNEAIGWFTNMKDTMLNSMTREDIKAATDQLVEAGIDKSKINKAVS